MTLAWNSSPNLFYVDSIGLGSPQASKAMAFSHAFALPTFHFGRQG
jgi:hypothetical protein